MTALLTNGLTKGEESTPQLVLLWRFNSRTTLFLFLDENGYTCNGLT